MQISTFTFVQKMRLANSFLRINAQALCVFWLRNRLELPIVSRCTLSKFLGTLLYHRGW